MNFKIGLISDERCREIDELNIICPYRYTNEKLQVKGDYFVHDVDENIIFGIGFIPIPDEMDYNSNVYILIIGKEYFFIYYKVKVIKEEIKDDRYYCQYIVYLEDNEKIDRNNNKKEILNLLKQMIPLKMTGYPFNNRVVTIELFYKGEEINNENL